MSSLVGPDLLEVVGGRQDLPGAAVQVVVEVAGHDGAGAQEIVVLERLCAKWFPFEVSLSRLVCAHWLRPKVVRGM